MNKEILYGAIISYVSFFTSAIIGIIYTPFMLSSLGTSEFGLYNIALSVCTYLMILDNGFNSSVIRYLAYYRGKGDTTNQQAVVSTSLVLYTGLGGICLVMGIVLYLLVPMLYGDSLTEEELSKLETIVLMIILYISVNFPMSVLQSMLTAHEKFAIIKTTKFAASLLMPLIMTPLLLMGYKAITMSLVSITIGISSSLCYLAFVKKLKSVKISYKKYDKDILRQLVRSSIPLFVVMICDCIHRSFGTFYIGMVTGTIGVTIFSLVIQMRNYVETFVKALSTLFLPKFSMQVSDKECINLFSTQFGIITRFEVHLALLILFGFTLFGFDFYTYWAKDVDTMILYNSTLLLLSLLVIPMSMSVGEEIVKALNMQKYLMYCNVLKVILALIIMFAYTKNFGSYACAFALGISSFVFDTLFMSIVYRAKIRMNLHSLFITLIKNYVPVILICTFVYIQNIYEYAFFYKIIILLLYCTFYFYVELNNYEKSLIFNVINKIRR